MRWELANCRGIDPDLMHPERGESTAEAKAVCQGCTIKADCLEFALANRPGGVWGGTTDRQRRRIRAARKAVA